MCIYKEIMLVLTVGEYIKFKEAYKEAISKGKQVFIFDGQEVYVDYAKYLIEYLKDKV